MFARRRHNEMIMKLCFAAMWSKPGYNVSPRPAVCSSISVRTQWAFSWINRTTRSSIFSPIYSSSKTPGTSFSRQTFLFPFSCHLDLVCVWLLSLSPSSFFQALTTWRLYFLPPKIPAKVIFSRSHVITLQDVTFSLASPTKLSSVELYPWQQVETTFNFLEIRALNSQPDHQVCACVCVYLIACLEYRVVRYSSVMW